jgi:type I restriction enzyme S subunit
MNAKWTSTTVGDFCPFIYGKGLPADKRKPGDIPVVSSAGITGTHDKSLVNKKGIVIGRKGTVGSLTYCDRPFWAIDTAFYIADEPNKRDLRYTYYLLKTLSLDSMNSDSAVPGLNRDNAHSIEITVPSLEVQNKIALHLSVLDDKIAVNQRLNATLQEMVRALFQSWFVDFDPVKAKLDSIKLVGIDAVTASLFPETFQDSELGRIPKGWRAGRLSESFDITMGQSPPGKTYNEIGDGLPFYQGRADFGFRFPKRRIYCTAPNRKAADRDTLVSVRAPVGDINMSQEESCIGRGVAAVRHKSGASSFTYYAMANLYPEFLKFESGGTVFGSINKDSFEQLSFVMPPADVVKEFERIAIPLDEKIRLLTKQSQTLVNIRDTLLPKLLSGDLSVENL